MSSRSNLVTYFLVLNITQCTFYVLEVRWTFFLAKKQLTYLHWNFENSCAVQVFLWSSIVSADKQFRLNCIIRVFKCELTRSSKKRNSRNIQTQRTRKLEVELGHKSSLSSVSSWTSECVYVFRRERKRHSSQTISILLSYTFSRSSNIFSFFHPNFCFPQTTWTDKSN